MASGREMILGESAPSLNDLYFGRDEEGFNQAGQTARNALATARTGREAAQGMLADGVGQSFGLADLFAGIQGDYEYSNAREAGLTRERYRSEDEMLRRLGVRAAGVGKTPGEIALDRSFRSSTAGQAAIAAGAGATGAGLITAQRQGQRSGENARNRTNAARGMVRLRDQYTAQDQLVAAMAQRRRLADGQAGLSARMLSGITGMAGRAAGGAYDTGINREQAASSLLLGQQLAQLQSDVSLEGLLSAQEPSEGIFSGLMSAAGSMMGGFASMGGGGGGG